MVFLGEIDIIKCNNSNLIIRSKINLKPKTQIKHNLILSQSNRLSFSSINIGIVVSVEKREFKRVTTHYIKNIYKD